MHFDPTLEHPRCVFQVLKRHYSRYTPELVEDVCGVPPEQFLQVAEALCANSGRDRTSAFCYAVGWTQHTVGVQYIRTAAIVQLLLGNIGRPGGGILALRGHATIQGSTDVPTLYNLLPGYLPMPKSKSDATFGEYLTNNESNSGWWSEFPKYIVSILKAWWGENATEANDWCYDHLPRLTGDHSHMVTVADMADGKVRGYFVMGENPVVGSMHGTLHKKGLRELDWLVVRDFSLIETAEFWQEDPSAIPTEVFFFPAATHTEKDGTYTNTQRLLQFHHKAVEPPGDCRSELWFMFHLGRKLRVAVPRVDRSEGRAAARAHVGLRNGRRPRRAGRAGDPEGDQRLHRGGRRAGLELHRPEGRRLHRVRLLDLLRLQQGRREPVRPAQARVASNTGWRPTGDGRGRRTAACSTTGRRPTRTANRGPSARRTCGGTTTKASGPATTYPTSSSIVPPRTGRPRTPRASNTIAGDTPFIMQADGRGWLYAPTGVLDGPLPTHYEPQESPFDNPLYRQQRNPARMEWNRRRQPLPPPFR